MFTGCTGTLKVETYVGKELQVVENLNSLPTKAFRATLKIGIKSTYSDKEKLQSVHFQLITQKANFCTAISIFLCPKAV